MIKQTTCYICDKPIEPEWLPEGEFIVCDECSSDTDKQLLEKLQEQLNTTKKALTEIAVIPTKFDDGGAGEIAVEIASEALAALEGVEKMSEIIKCPICHKMAGIRYDINRVYQSRCQNMECRETVTVTAPSEAVAEELFYRFEKGTNQPQLTIPKSVADELDGFNPNAGETKIALLIEGYNECFISDELMQFCLVDNNLNLCALYLAGKALGVDLVKVVEG